MLPIEFSILTLLFSTPLPPPTVHQIKRLDDFDNINNFEILNIYILIQLCSDEMNGSFRYFEITGWSTFILLLQENYNVNVQYF